MLRSDKLGLYKKLLRYGQNLKFTDKKYFEHRIRKGFLNNRALQDEQEIDFHYKKGLELLNQKRVV